MSRNLDTEYGEFGSAGKMEYWQAYGLHEDPFDEEKKLFLIPEWVSHLEFIHHVVRYSNYLVAVCGPIDCGKTRFLTKFRKGISDDVMCYQVEGDANFSVTELMHVLMHSFELPNYSLEKLSLKAKITEHLNHMQRSNKQCVLFIDDAHQIPMETLETIFRILRQQKDEQANLHFVLSGEAELEENLELIEKKFPSKDRQFQAIHLKGLSLAETEQYLASCLMHAGMIDGMLFVQSDIKNIYKLSEGVIGRISRVAKQLLMDRLVKKNRPWQKIWRKHQHKFSYGSVFALALFTVGFSNYFKESVVPNTSTLATASVIKKTVIAKRDASQQLVQASMGPDMLARSTTAVMTLLHVEWNQLLQTIMQNRFVEYATLSPIPLPIKPTDKQDLVKPKKHFVLQAQKITRPHHTREVQQRVLQKSKHRLYTIQLLAAREMGTILAFMDKHDLKKKASYFRTVFKGKDWFVLVYGKYASFQAASNAVKHLPRRLKHYKPWPRNYAGIHKAIASYSPGIKVRKTS